MQPTTLYTLSVNPFRIWSAFAWKTGEMMLASVQVIGHRSNRMLSAGSSPSAGARRDALKRWDQCRDQQQVTVARQEDERRGQSDELTDDGYLGAGLGVERLRKAEPHLPQVLGRGARRNGGARSRWPLS